MPSIHDLKQSRFISKGDLGPNLKVLVTIRGWEEVNVAMDNMPPDIKYALQFEEFEKSFVLNQTNGGEIAEITGEEDFDNWTGVKIVLYFDKNVMFGQKKVGGIRVRAPLAPNQNLAPQAAPPVRQAPRQSAPAPAPQQAPADNFGQQGWESDPPF